MFKEFREFIKRGNVLELAVAVVLAVAFGRIVTTLVEGVIMPPIGQLLGKVDFANLFYDLSGQKPQSLAAARAAGLPVIAYGQLVNDLISFVIVAFVVFLIVRAFNRMKNRQGGADGPVTKDCPYCLSTIPLKATRCSECCIDLQTI